MAGKKESNLVTVPDINPSDRIRIVQEESSRNIRYSDLLNDLDDRLFNQGLEQELKFKTITNNYTFDLVEDEIILINCQTGDITVTMPPAAEAITIPGQSPTYIIKKISDASFDGHVIGTAAETIDGHDVVNLIDERLPMIKIMSDGNKWLMIT